MLSGIGYGAGHMHDVAGAEEARSSSCAVISTARPATSELHEEAVVAPGEYARATNDKVT